MRKGLPLTLADAELFARAIATHNFIARAEARQDGRTLRVRAELTGDAAFFFGAGEDGGILFDLAARPPRLALEGVERPDGLRETLEAAAAAALAEIARRDDWPIPLATAYGTIGLAPGCGIEAVQRWHGTVHPKSPVAWRVRASGIVSDLLIAEAARAKASAREP